MIWVVYGEIANPYGADRELICAFTEEEAADAYTDRRNLDSTDHTVTYWAEAVELDPDWAAESS